MDLVRSLRSLRARTNENYNIRVVHASAFMVLCSCSRSRFVPASRRETEHRTPNGEPRTTNGEPNVNTDGEARTWKEEPLMPPSPRARIAREVGSWDGVTVAPHRFGGVEFRVGRRELGHVHGDRLADLPFPIAILRELVAA